MAAKAIRIIFIFLNLLFWLLGVGLSIYVGWVFGTSTLQAAFVSGTAIFTYVLVGLALLITITGCFGCGGATRRALCPLRMYLVLMVLLLIIQAGIAIFFHYRRSEFHLYMKMAWDQSNQETRNALQNQIQCCGFYNATEYGGNIDKSCYNTSASNASHVAVYQVGCQQELLGWFNNNVAVWASMLVSVMLIEIVATLLSCSIISNVEHINRVGDSSTKNQNGDTHPVSDECIVSDEPISLNENNEKPTSTERIFVTERIMHPHSIDKPNELEKPARWHHLTEKGRRHRSSRTCWQWCKQDCMEIETVTIFLNQK